MVGTTVVAIGAGATEAAAAPIRMVRVGRAKPYRPAADPMTSAPVKVAAAAPLAIASARLSTIALLPWGKPLCGVEPGRIVRSTGLSER
jgi:hypothetical protein